MCVRLTHRTHNEGREKRRKSDKRQSEQRLIFFRGGGEMQVERVCARVPQDDAKKDGQKEMKKRK